MNITSKSGKTIVLRPPTQADLNLIYQYALELGNEDTFVLLNPQEPVTLAEEKRSLTDWIKKIKAGDLILLLALDQQTLIGLAQIGRGGRRSQHTGHMGISLKASYRGDGIGYKFAEAVINQAINKMKLQLILLELFSQNHTAHSLYKKLGFVEYGRLPNAHLYKGKFVEEILMYKKV